MKDIQDIQTKEEFIKEFNKFNERSGWEFKGNNPFTEKNLENHRVRSSLISFAELLGFDDPDDLYNLTDYFDELN